MCQVVLTNKESVVNDRYIEYTNQFKQYLFERKFDLGDISAKQILLINVIFNTFRNTIANIKESICLEVCFDPYNKRYDIVIIPRY
jgi:alpha-amylase/alpha-mannosidase (GH57 family)